MTKPNTIAADLRDQTEQDDPDYMIVKRADLEEAKSLLEGCVWWFNDDRDNDGGCCPTCGAYVGDDCDPDCERSNAETLLARMDKAVSDG